jgi:hypothetical protein
MVLIREFEGDVSHDRRGFDFSERFFLLVLLIFDDD